MKKPASLKNYLIERTPWLKEDPTRIITFVENGLIRATGAASHSGACSHEYSYRLSIVIQAFPGDIEHITVPILEWLKVNQSDMVDNPTFQQNGLPFDVDVLDTGTVDLEISINNLTERVIALPSDTPDAQYTADRYKISNPAEPQRDELLALPEQNYPNPRGVS